jgi:antitoxin MazE
MIKKLVKHGNSYALILDKPILELLKIDPDTGLEILTNGDSIIIRPVRDEARSEAIRAAHERINDQYGNVFKKLAE